MKGKDNFIQWQIAALLLAMLVSNAYFATLAQQGRRAQVELTEERHAIYQEHIQQMQASLARRQRVITSARDRYCAAAYGPGIDRIAEQQLIAAEYQILLLQTIAQQNAQMIELMTVMGP